MLATFTAPAHRPFSATHTTLRINQTPVPFLTPTLGSDLIISVTTRDGQLLAQHELGPPRAVPVTVQLQTSQPIQHIDVGAHAHFSATTSYLRHLAAGDNAALRLTIRPPAEHELVDSPRTSQLSADSPSSFSLDSPRVAWDSPRAGVMDDQVIPALSATYLTLGHGSVARIDGSVHTINATRCTLDIHPSAHVAELHPRECVFRKTNHQPSQSLPVSQSSSCQVELLDETMTRSSALDTTAVSSGFTEPVTKRFRPL